MATGYPYRPLRSDVKQIRILWIDERPISDESPLRCRLEHVNLDLDRRGEYIAISYTWGDAAKRRPMIIDGIEVSVPESSDEALRNLYDSFRRKWYKRLRRRPRLYSVWIDAISIDQNNVPERNEQVKLMRYVYSNALRVDIWLGKDTNGSAKVAMRAIIEMSDYIFNQRKGIEGTRPSINQTGWEALGWIFSAAWFTRAWVVQEALLNDDTVCFKGDKSIGIDRIITGANFPQIEYPRLEAGFTDLTSPALEGWKGASLMEHLRLHARRRSLTGILSIVADYQAKDPRDKVYGFLGLLDDETIDAIDVGYDKPVEEVYLTATKLAIVRDQDLYLLKDAFSRSKPASEAAFPSWGARWDMELSHSAHIFLASPKSQITGKTPDKFRISIEGNDLKAYGLNLGDIADDPFIIVPYEEGEPVDSELDNLQRARSLWADTQRDKLEREVSRELALTLSAGYDPHSDIESLFELQGNTLAHSAFKYRNALEDIRTKSGGRSLFVSTTGYLGTAWPTAKKGDTVCILFGCEFTLVLRPKGDRWELIGDAYVHGARAYYDRLRDKGLLEETARQFVIC